MNRLLEGDDKGFNYYFHKARFCRIYNQFLGRKNTFFVHMHIEIVRNRKNQSSKNHIT
jgi:hypothetical protein